MAQVVALILNPVGRAGVEMQFVTVLAITGVKVDMGTPLANV